MYQKFHRQNITLELTWPSSLAEVLAFCFSKAVTASGSADFTAKNKTGIGNDEELGFAPLWSNNEITFWRWGFLNEKIY